MNGHFEADNSTYPITYMNAPTKGLYCVTDMRCLHKLDTRELPVHVAKRVCQHLNIRVHNMKYSDNSAASPEIKADAFALINAVLEA